MKKVLLVLVLGLAMMSCTVEVIQEEVNTEPEVELCGNLQGFYKRVNDDGELIYRVNLSSGTAVIDYETYQLFANAEVLFGEFVCVIKLN